MGKLLSGLQFYCLVSIGEIIFEQLTARLSLFGHQNMASKIIWFNRIGVIIQVSFVEIYDWRDIVVGKKSSNCNNFESADYK